MKAKPPVKKTTITLEGTMHRELKMLAVSQGMPLTAIIEHALSHFLWPERYASKAVAPERHSRCPSGWAVVKEDGAK